MAGLTAQTPDPSFEPDALERDPENTLRRREFLQRTAVTAGLGAGLAATLSPDTVLAHATRRAHRRALPSPRNLPIDTFVVLMMENRSFDHYLGWLPNADGRQAGLTYTDRQGRSFATHRLLGNYQGCGYADPDHSWQGGRTELNNGRMDGFLRAGSDVFSIGYYEQQDLPFIPSIAREFTAFDRFFCSLLASTYPNREYMHAAQSYGRVDNTLPTTGLDPLTIGFPDSTIFAALTKAGVSSRYFYTDLPISAFWGVPGLLRTSRVSEFYEHCAAGTLPSVSYVDPAFNGEDGGTSGDEHPHGDVRTGQAFMSDVVHAFMASPQWKRGALFVIYDEWGGFFDHVAPPRVPDLRSSASLASDFGQMGLRIPAVAISPYVRRAHVDHGIYGFESILKMIRYRFGLPPLTIRDKYARNIARAFDFDAEPDYDVPHLPSPAHVMSAACNKPALPLGLTAPQLSALRAKPHDVVDMLTSGYLERLGFKYEPATPASMFRHPHSLRRHR